MRGSQTGNLLACRTMYRHLVALQQGRQAADVVAVMVGDEDADEVELETLQRGFDRRSIARVNDHCRAVVVQKPQVVVGKRRNRRDTQTHGVKYPKMNAMDEPMSNNQKPASLHDWLSTPLGAYVLDRERAWLDQTTPDIFGYHALQLGLPQVDLLRESRIVQRLRVDPAQSADLRAGFGELPIATQSVDLVLLPHLLEFADAPHDILREIDRIMIPEGRLIILGFNPWSLFGARRVLGGAKDVPWSGRFVSLVRIKDWLSLLGFDVSAGNLACYAPPMKSEKWIRRFGFLEQAGDRWWGVSGGVYMLQAIKRVRGMRIITPAWADKKAAEKKFATAAKQQEAARSSTHLTLIK